MKRYAVSLLLLLGLAVAGAAPAPVRAGPGHQQVITFEVQVGYNGAYRIAEWFPIVVTVANNGRDVRGVLEWRFPGQSDQSVFRRAIDLPGGSSKRVTLYVFSRDFVQSGQVRLLDGDTELAERQVNLGAIDADRFLIGVVSSDPALLNSLNSSSSGAADGMVVQHLDAAALPEHAAALRGVNALFLHDMDSGALAPAQRDALALWVRLGGQLIVSGGAGGQQTAAGLADLLPVDVAGGVAQGDLAPLASFAGAGPSQPSTTTLSDARPREGAEQPIPGAPLLFRWRRGAGSVAFSAFDLAVLRGWSGETRLWQQLLAPNAIFAPGTDSRQQRSNLLQDVLELPSLGLPSAATLFCFLLAYIIMIGPLNYLLLRRRQRLEWAWLTVPLAVLVFAGGLYVVGFGLRGGRSQLNQMAIVQGVEGQPRGFGTAFVGLFSPRRASYTLDFPADSLVSETRDWTGASGQAAAVIGDDDGVEVPDVLIDVASVRTFTAEMAVDVPVSVRSDLRDSRGEVRGEIRNTGAEPLADTLIVRGEAFQPLGTIAPGAVQQVTLPGAARSYPVPQANNFPWAVSLPPSGVFNRQHLLASLFSGSRVRFNGPNGPSSAALDTQSIYLLAWSSHPLVPVGINGQGAAQEGLTLYIIRLNAKG